MKKIYRANESLAFTGLLIFGICGLAFMLISISEGTFYKALWVHFIYFSLLTLYYVGAKWGTYISICGEKIYGSAFFLRSSETNLKAVTAIEDTPMFGGQLTQIQMQIVKNGKYKRRGLTTVESLTKEDFKDLISEIKKINPDIIIPESLLK